MARRGWTSLFSPLNVTSALLLVAGMMRVIVFMRFSSQNTLPSLKGGNIDDSARRGSDPMRRDIMGAENQGGRMSDRWDPLEHYESAFQQPHLNGGLRNRADGEAWVGDNAVIGENGDQLPRQFAVGHADQAAQSREGLPLEPLGAERMGLAKREDWGKGKKVLIFTMDSLDKTVAAANRGGPAGEIKVRESLTKSLKEAGVQVDIATSDGDFRRRTSSMAKYHAVVLDPWTWADDGWKLKTQLKGLEGDIFIMDFFGSEVPHKNLGVPAQRFLTAFPTPSEREHTFLGYRMDNSQTPAQKVEKKQQGIIWGKTKKSFEGAATRKLIDRLAEIAEVHSTVAFRDVRSMRGHDNVVFHGVLSKEEWSRLLQESKFMMGLGHPLSGPSAVDAVASGCAYINPVYSSPKKTFYTSQHPYLQQAVGEPYVCSYKEKDVEEALECARKALGQELEPMVPDELTNEAHKTRVRNIFQPMFNKR